LNENPIQLAALAAGFGWDIQKAVDEGMLTLLYFSADDIYIDEFSNRLLSAIRSRAVDRLVIDGLGDLEAVAGSQEAFRDFVYALVQNLLQSLVSAMFTYRVTDLFALTPSSRYGLSHMAENLVLLSYDRRDRELQNIMTIIKTHGSAHDRAGRRFEVTSQGINEV
jgi:circadian clock protein KaiC